MKSRSKSETRANISNLVDATLTDGPQRTERPDSTSVMVVSEELQRKLAAEYPSLADLVLNAPIDEIDLPGRARPRLQYAKLRLNYRCLQPKADNTARPHPLFNRAMFASTSLSPGSARSASMRSTRAFFLLPRRSWE